MIDISVRGTQRSCLMKRKDGVCFVFFIIFLFEFWGFFTILLFIITRNIEYEPLILNIISQCFFILFEHAKKKKKVVVVNFC